jgi:hypothetical protein
LIVLQNFYGSSFEDLFVSEKRNSNEYNYIFLVNSKHMLYILIFLDKPEFHLVPLVGAITYLKVNFENYDFSDHGLDSFLSISLSVAGGELYLEPLIARNVNCDKLLEITKKYLIPNVVDMIDISEK